MTSVPNVRPLSARIGVEVTGLDLSLPLDPAVGEHLRKLLDTYSLVLFRGIDIAPDLQVALLAQLGPVTDELEDGRYYTQLSTIEKESDFSQNRLLYHQDYVHTPYQHSVISLYGEKIDPARAVPTYFASCRGAAMDLPAKEAARMASLRAVQVVDVVGGVKPESARVRLDQLATMPPETTHPRATHPVLKMHPRTGEKLLFIHELQTSHIEGIGSDESEKLIQYAHSLLYAPINTYAHEWQETDLVIWDNIALQHARAAPVPGSRRTMRRVVVNPHPGQRPAAEARRARGC